MSDCEIVLNTAGVRELLQSPQMEAVCKENAEAIKSRCGFGYALNSMVGKNRVNVMVWAETQEARQDNLENNTLLKAVK